MRVPRFGTLTMVAMSEFGKQLRSIRKRAGLSQRALGKAARVTHATISDLELGKTDPRPSTARALAGALGIPVAVLHGASEAHDAPQKQESKWLPMFGVVPAGPPAEADGQLMQIPVSPHMGGNDRYVLRVWGDSMYPKYQRDDLVLVEYLDGAEPELLHGKTCVCLYRGGSTLKVIDVQKTAKGRRIVLRGANERSPVIEIDPEAEFTIQARVICLMERMD